MNKHNIDVSIRAVKEIKHFNMSDYFDGNPYDCETACCIAGATALTTEFKADGGIIDEDHICAVGLNNCWGADAMAEFWDCSRQQAYDICVSKRFYGVKDLSLVTKEQAIKALEDLKR